jgi:hypothetical protein
VPIWVLPKKRLNRINQLLEIQFPNRRVAVEAEMGADALLAH